MSDVVQPLPPDASLEQQRKRAKDLLKACKAGDAAALRRVRAYRADKPKLALADAQLTIAREAGYRSWTALKRALSVASPLRHSPLHVAAADGDLGMVEALLARGADPGARDSLDKATPLHFAAGGGHLPVVQRLLDAGADAHGEGDDHDLGVLGWATCLNGYHEHVALLLLARGARHHVFSAIAMDDSDWVRREIAADPTLLTRRMSRNEHHRSPLHHAVRKNRPRMVRLLLELGVDPRASDATGATALTYATRTTAPEIVEALRGAGLEIDLIGALRMHRFDLAEQLLRENPALLRFDSPGLTALHLSAFDRNLEGVRWLIAHGADVNAKRELWGCNHTALHLCAEHDIRDIAKALLQAGADPDIKDDKYQSTVLEWAEFCGRPEIASLVAEARR